MIFHNDIVVVNEDMLSSTQTEKIDLENSQKCFKIFKDNNSIFKNNEFDYFSLVSWLDLM